jgi:hypothetical protein
MSFSIKRQAADLSSGTLEAATSKALALKEWAVVCKALEKGRQTILLRKGGIMEYRQGFEVKHNDFFLYPTFEHQSKEYLQNDYLDELDNIPVNRPVNNRSTITAYAKAVEVRETNDERVLQQLRKFHIWNDHYVSIRLNYNPKRPMSVILLRVYKMSKPLEIENRPEFAGCKSWIPIPLSNSDKIQHIPGRLNSVIGPIQPVLDDSDFSEIVTNIRQVLD